MILLSLYVFGMILCPSVIGQTQEEGQETDPNYIQIDDMRFRTGELSILSGFTGTRWTSGDVFYEFDSAVTATNQQRWIDASNEWAAVADLNFIEKTNQANWIYVKNDPENWSYVGMINDMQEMGINSWSSEFIIVHEIGHALGLMHEHQRSDRDNYVNILTDNIEAGKEDNFDKATTTNYGSYDFDSVMHYPKDAFSSNGNTIEPLLQYSDWLDKIGQRDHLSELDKKGMQIRYGGKFPASADTTISEYLIDSNFGSSSEMGLSGVIGHRSYSLVKFNLGSIPSGSTINSVELKLYARRHFNPGNVDTWLSILGQSWSESTATWNNQPSVGSGLSIWKKFTGSGYHTWSSEFHPSLNSLAQNWVNGTKENNGFLIVLEQGTQADTAYYTKEWSTSSQRPKLIVTYTAPPTPDLIISDLYPVPDPVADTFYIGQEIRWEVTVKNNSSDGSAGSSYLGYYLGNSPTDISENTRITHPDLVDSLTPGQSDQENQIYSFDSSDVGTKYLICKADYDDNVDEADENNNTRVYGPFYVVPSTGALAVNITPLQATDDGARWRLTSGSDTNWHYSGDMLSVETGSYSIEFQQVDGWETPESQDVSITSSGLTINATYVIVLGPDINRDGIVNLFDYSLLSAKWAFDNCEVVNNWCNRTDINKSGSVGIDDLFIMDEHWLDGAIVSPLGMVWVFINDPGVSGHEGFVGEMSKYETTNAQYCEYLNAAKADGVITVYDNQVYATSDTSHSQVYFDTSNYTSYSQITWSGTSFSVRSRKDIYNNDIDMSNHPVVEVSWYGATAFCNYYGYRLPTEWEWQAVADHTVEDPYTYGCGISIDHSKANYNLDNPLGLTSYSYTSPVNHYSSYGYGMNDMAGNAWEWTNSIDSGSNRVIRGGGWYTVPGDNCSVSHRNHDSPDRTGHGIGFRVVRDDLMGYWKLDETSGPVVDETGNNNGVNYEAARGVAGKVGNAFDFDGINDYVSIPYSSDFAYTIGQDNVTVSAWVYPFDKDNPDHGAIYSDRAVDNDVAAIVMAINQGYFYLGGWSPTATDYSVPQVLVPSNNQWYLMTGVFNSTEAKLYINGDLESSTSLTGVSLANGGTGMMLGKAQGGYWENYFDGKIDEVKIWNRALSASEVKSLFENP